MLLIITTPRTLTCVFSVSIRIIILFVDCCNFYFLFFYVTEIRTCWHITSYCSCMSAHTYSLCAAEATWRYWMSQTQTMRVQWGCWTSQTQVMTGQWGSWTTQTHADNDRTMRLLNDSNTDNDMTMRLLNDSNTDNDRTMILLNDSNTIHYTRTSDIFGIYFQINFYFVTWNNAKGRTVTNSRNMWKHCYMSEYGSRNSCFNIVLHGGCLFLHRWSRSTTAGKLQCQQ